MIRPTKDSQHCCKDVEGRNVSAGLLIFDPCKNILDLPGETRKFNSCFLNILLQPVVTQSVRARAGSLSEEEEDEKRRNQRQDKYQLRPHG